MNGLADITVGYLGAPLNMKKLFQWILVRTEKGEMLRDLIQPDLEMGAESTRGDSSKSVINGAKRIVEQMRPENEMPLKTGRKVPIWAGKILAAILTRVGPSGLSYAHYAVDLHLVRDYYYVKFYQPELIDTLVPKSVYAVLEKYGFQP
jgi:coenzyme F420 hydrogenase subunit beta